MREAIILLVVVSLPHLCYTAGDCDVCSKFVEAFDRGLKLTENSNYAGGDTSYEEESMPVYADSEVRLVEVLDNVCDRSDYKCLKFLEHNEEEVERWWLKLRLNGNKDLKQWLCFTHLNVCCPENTYGPSCSDCPGGALTPCSGHGRCQGSGEKDGSGDCVCDAGYEGELCDLCSDGYYNESSSCLSCDSACKKSCTGAGPAKCEECASGYRREEDKEEEPEGKPEEEEEEDEDKERKPCIDINECEEEPDRCADGQYCSNSPGSYQCRACDKSCRLSCTGMGAGKCVECAEGYKNTSGYCIDINECAEETFSCEEGTHCDNTDGSYKCLACDVSCNLTCRGSGPSQCDECKEGYTMNEGSCVDVDECSSSTPPCDNSTELCVNSKGSFLCKCKPGHTRVAGKCQPKSSNTDKAKKSKKKTKKRKGNTAATTSEDKNDSSSSNSGSPSLHQPVVVDTPHEEL